PRLVPQKRRRGGPAVDVDDDAAHLAVLRRQHPDRRLAEAVRARNPLFGCDRRTALPDGRSITPSTGDEKGRCGEDRHARPHPADQPWTAPSVRPRTKCRWTSIPSSRAGSSETIVRALVTPYCAPCMPTVVLTLATGSVTAVLL